MDYPFDLARFIEAQRGSYDQALAELTAGEKRSRWMWFIFPQLAGLGTSAMAQHYAISGLDEARAYLRHPVFGERLRTCTAAVNAITGRTAHQVFGSPGDMKFRSSMTLFGRAGQNERNAHPDTHKRTKLEQGGVTRRRGCCRVVSSSRRGDFASVGKQVISVTGRALPRTG